MKLSYIITYHNGKKYIDECVESLYRQNMPESDFEVILVDDKSEDAESIAVIEKFKKYPNYKIIHNIVNLKQGESRNVGLRIAKGDYVWFIDQDDYIVDDCACALLDISISRSLDFLIFNNDIKNINSVNTCTQINPTSIYDSGKNVMTGLDYLENVCEGNYANPNVKVYVWNKIYRRNFLVGQGINFPKTESEDNCLVVKSLINALKVASCNKICYVYRVHEESFMHTVKLTKGYILCDATLFLGSILFESSMSVPETYRKTKTSLYSSSMHLVNSVIKPLLKKTRREKIKFYERYEDYSSQISKAKDLFGSWTRFALSHRFWVMNIPFTLRIIIKGRELIAKSCKSL